MFAKLFRKKPVLSVVLSVCLMMNFSYTAFAADDFPQGFVPPSWVDGGETYIGVLDLREFSETEKSLLFDIMTSPFGLFRLQYTFDIDGFVKQPTSLVFYMLEDGVILKDEPPPTSYTHIFAKDGVEKKYPTITFNLNASSATLQKDWIWTPKRFTSGYVSTEKYLNLSLGTDSYGNEYGNLLIGGDYLSSITGSASSFIKTCPSGDIHFLYIPVDTPPEPTPTPPPVELPDPPSPPEITQPPIAYPTFPKIENIYVPYDTTIWNKFADTIRSSIGSSTNIGFGILAMVLGVFVVLRIIHKFTGTGSKHD